MSISSEKNIKCPFCSEKIKASAKKCRFCGEWLNNDSTVQTHISSKSQSNLLSLKKIIIFVVVVLILIQLKNTFLSNSVINVNNPTTNIAQMNENTLRETILDYQKLIQSSNESDLRRLYRDFYVPNSAVYNKTEDEFIKDMLERNSKVSTEHIEFETNSIKIIGQRGYVDLTAKHCLNSSCSQIKSIQRYYNLFTFYQNKWLASTDEPILCIREKPYDIPPEFNRIIDLIIQRTENYNFSISELPKFRNCVDIQYAKSDSEMNGAEGQFSFIKGQSPDKLEILVSPRYKIKDDLITATLLVHELTHANRFIYGLMSGEPLSCFEDEAGAFQNENWFITILNPEEKASINARLLVGGSDEVRQIQYLIDGMNQAAGATSEEKALNFVKSQPAYQKQCANN